MRRPLFLPLLALVALGCSSFDTTRTVIPRGTLGEEVVRAFCERMASEANPSDVGGLGWKPVCRGESPPPSIDTESMLVPARMRVLLAHRERLAGAIDRVLPEGLHDDLGHFLGQLLPLYDPPAERLPRSTRIVAELLDRIAGDEQALQAMVRISAREGYRPLRLALGIMRPLLAYPEFADFARLAIRSIAEGGVADDEWREVQRALALELATLSPAEAPPAGEASTMDRVRELVFTQEEELGGGGPFRYALVRDSRGMALPAGGAVVAPWVDRDLDGLADLDASGRFVDGSGAPLDLAAPFRIRGESGIARDSSGRALRTDGTRIWEYVEIDRSVLAGALREAGPLFDPMASPGGAPALRLARGLPAMLGPEIELRETYGTATLRYLGHDTRSASLVDVVYALAEMMHREETDRALALSEILLRDHEAELAGLLGASAHMLDRRDDYPEARLRQPNVLWDELIALGIEYSHEPDLLEAMLRSFADPRSAQLGTVYGGLMRHRDAITFDPSNVNNPPLGFPLDERVDRTRPDVAGNESLFQRSIALIDGLDGVRVCNREGAVLHIRLGPLPIQWPLFGEAGACGLIDITNVAEAYALAILGRYRLEIQDRALADLVEIADRLGINVDDVLERSSGINGLTQHPTPQALNRLVFWGLADDDGDGNANSEFAGDLFERIRDRHGNDVIDTYPGTIAAWEQPGFYEGMSPLLEVLHDPRFAFARDGTYRFGQLIRTIHRHWATESHWITQRTDPSAPNFSYQDDARSYEELIADGFVEGRMLDRMQRVNAALDGVEVAPGLDGIDVLAAAAETMIDPDRNPGLRTRDGRASIPWNSGSESFAVTPLLLVLDALGRMDRDLAAAPERRIAWEEARDELASRFLGTRTLGDGYELENRRGRAILLAVLPFLRARLADHRTRGDLVEWSRELVPDTEELLRSPLAAALIRFLDRVQDDPEAQAALSDLIRYLVDPASSDDAFIATLQAAADLLFVIEDDENIIPIGRALAAALAPNAREVVAGGSSADALDLGGSLAGDGLGLIQAVQDLDEDNTLAAILRNLVELDDAEDATTPLEEILDVIAEINRASPGETGPFDVADYRAAMGTVREVMLDERRGLERLYDVVQQREIRDEP